MTSSSDATTPPAIILGGEANALAVARDLGRIGVAVYVLSTSSQGARHSRYAQGIDIEPREWKTFLLGPESNYLRGAVLLTCSDHGIQFLVANREALRRKYKLDLSDPVAQIAMLDKLQTYEHGRAAGVPTPRFWKVGSVEQIRELRAELVFPLVVKPRLSHIFERAFGRKHVIVRDFDELLQVLARIRAAQIDVLLMEYIPGGDDQLCSYYTYLDETGTPQFHFTKRIIRRYPANMGAACYHITDWIPELIEPANALFRRVGLRGLANVEFKLDPRDGQYKLIEVNARFTASNCLVSRSGFNLAVFVYNRLTDQPSPMMAYRETQLRLWDPLRDLLAFLESAGVKEHAAFSK